MVLQPDQQRVCTMLKDTITLLCKNGLAFKKKFAIEAVIGVTLDDEFMFHVSLNEVVRSSVASDDDSDSRSSQDAEAKQHRQKRRKRPRIKRERGGSAGSSDDDKSDSPSQNGDQSGSNLPDVPSPAKRADIKGEPADYDNNAEEQDDIVFVKQEMDDGWSQSCSQGASNFAFSGVGDTPSQHDPNISLSDMTLVPVDQGQNNSAWSQDGMPRQQYRPRMRRTSTVTTGGQPPGMQTQPAPDGQPTGTDQQQASVGGKLSCSFCGKLCTTKWNLKTHEDWHKGKGYYPCKYCGKTFMATSTLQGHMSIHTGIKEFKCLICGREFGWKGDLKKHLNNIHHWNLPRERRSSPRKSNICEDMTKKVNKSHAVGP